MTTATELYQIADAVRTRRRFVLSSHARPDGDAIGSQLAMAYALRSLGKDVRLVNADPAPPFLQTFPGVADIEIAPQVDGDFDAAIIMECGSLSRTGVSGFERFFVINIDHHPGNAAYGQINWFDPSAAACGEMVFDLVQTLGVPLTREIATHVYLAILTDTGSFHYAGISPRTFDICRQTLEAGVDPVSVARAVYDNNSLGRLKLFAAVLGAIEVAPSNRVAVLYLDQAIARAAGATYEDTDALVNQPLTVREIEAVAFFKKIQGDEYRVSLRSKGSVDVASVAREYGGGGHRNAAGCTAVGRIDELKQRFVDQVERAVALATPNRTF